MHEALSIHAAARNGCSLPWYKYLWLILRLEPVTYSLTSFYIPCCFCDDVASVGVTNDPVPPHSIFTCCIYPCIYFYHISPVVKNCYLYLNYNENIKNGKIEKRGIPGAILFNLDLYASDHPNEFPKTHFSGSPKSITPNPWACHMI